MQVYDSTNTNEAICEGTHGWQLGTNSEENISLTASVRSVESGAENMKLIVCVQAVEIGAVGIGSIASVRCAVLLGGNTYQVAGARVARNAVKSFEPQSNRFKKEPFLHPG